MVAKAESSVWERIVEPSWDNLGNEAAQAILRLQFRPADTDRMNELARRAQEGELSDEQRQELETYNRVGHVLAILQSKARIALRRPPER